MKNKDLSNAIGNINLKYVEEAENFTAKRMSLTKIVSLAACIAILVTAIPAALILNREDGKTDAPVVMPMGTEDQTVVKNPESFKIIYCSSEEAQNFKEALKDQNVEIREDIDANFDLSARAEDFDSGLEIPAKVYLTFQGKDYSFSFHKTYDTNLVNSTDEYLKTLGYEAAYFMDNNPYSNYGPLVLTYNYVTEQLIDVSFKPYLKPYQVGGETDIKLTEDEINAIAIKDMSELFGEDFSDQYTMYHTSYIDYHFEVNFRRYIGGYPTNERVYAVYNNQGELVKVGTNNFGSFKSFADELDEESILKADSEAMKLLEGKSIKDKFLSVGIDGKVYVTIRYKVPGDTLLIRLSYEVA